MSKERPRAALKISPGGAAVLLTSAVLFAVGFVRGELAALLWGGGFLFLCLVSLPGIFFTRGLNRRFLRENTGTELLLFQDRSCLPGVRLFEEPARPREVRALPGIIAEFRWEAFFHSRKLSLVIPQRKGKFSPEVSLVPRERGQYQSRVRMVIRDFPGIFRLFVPLAGSGTLTVFPSPREEEEILPLPALGGEQTPRERSLERNRELFDIRKFTPGDDPRRVHWKLYARSGELFLRQGEPEPPPSGRYQVFLDLSLPKVPKAGPSGLRITVKKEVCFEWFLARTSGLLVSLLSRGSALRLYVPGQSESVTFFPGDEKELLSFLSGLWFFSGESPYPGVIPAHVEGVYLCTTPLSPGAGDLHRRLAGTGESRRFPVQILCPRLPEKSPAEKSSLLRSWLFLPSGEKSPAAGPFSPTDKRFYLAWEEGAARLEALTEDHIVRIF